MHDTSRKPPPRIPIPDTASASESLKETFARIEAAMGRVPDIFKSIAGHPEAVRPLFESHQAILEKSSIDPRLRQIALIRASVKNGSDYCLRLHMDLGLKAGLTHKQIDALRYAPKGGEFTEVEVDVIAYADQVTREPSGVSDELFARLRNHFSEARIVNLTLIIGLINLFNRYSAALRLHPEE